MIVECRSKFVEKIVTDNFGRQFRAVFLVKLALTGAVKGRLVSLQPISEEVVAIEGAESDCGLCLPVLTSKAKAEIPYVSTFAPVISTYFTLDFFLSSQQTRAPAFK